MWNWISENSDAISAVTSAIMVVVWILYLQLLVMNLRHQARPKILINRGAGTSLEARCIITNMSAEAIYLESVLVTLDDGNRSVTLALADVGVPNGGERHPERWYQGPIASGELTDIGSYRSVIARCLRGWHRSGHACDFSNLQAVTLTAVASYTAREELIAAERTFLLDRAQMTLVPTAYSASQIRSGRRRRRIERFMLQDVRNSGGKPHVSWHSQH